MGVPPRTAHSDVVSALTNYAGGNIVIKALKSLALGLEGERSRGAIHAHYDAYLASALVVGDDALSRILHSAKPMGEFLRAVGDVKDEALEIIVELAREALGMKVPA
jgi:hypothetical protein